MLSVGEQECLVLHTGTWYVLWTWVQPVIPVDLLHVKLLTEPVDSLPPSRLQGVGVWLQLSSVCTEQGYVWRWKMRNAQ